MRRRGRVGVIRWRRDRAVGLAVGQVDLEGRLVVGLEALRRDIWREEDRRGWGWAEHRVFGAEGDWV